jgi:predicted PurR-regulated permease PerM
MQSFFGLSTKSIKIDNVTLLSIFAAIVGVYVFFQIKQVLMLFFLAFIIMVALNPIVKRFQVWGVRRSLSIFRTSPWFVDQLNGFQGDVTSWQEQLTGLQISISDVGTIFGSLQTPVFAVFSVVGAVFSNIFLVFSIFVMSYFLLVERPQLHSKLRWITKDTTKIEKAGAFLDKLELELGGWVRGELILMLTIGLLTYLGLALLNVPYAVPLALIAGLLELVPNIGPTIAAIPAIIIAATFHGPVSAAAVLGPPGCYSSYFGGISTGWRDGSTLGRSALHHDQKLVRFLRSTSC